MMIQVTITPDIETTKKLTFDPWAWSNFRIGVRQATEQLEAEVKKIAPRATGDFQRSIDSTTHEFDNPYRAVARVYSIHPAADTIEWGSDPHTVPIRGILRWMQAVNMNIRPPLTPEQVAFRIQHKIEERGLKPHHVFSSAYEIADQYFHSALDPILAALGGSATYDVELRSSGSHESKWN